MNLFENKPTILADPEVLSMYGMMWLWTCADQTVQMLILIPEKR
jgi:hypothetical protein